MRTGRKTFAVTILLLVFSFLLCGCEEAASYYSEAALRYGRAEYEDAESFFISALESGDDAAEVHIGHAYNLLRLQRYPEAVDEFLHVLTDITDKETTLALRKAMLEAYLKDNNLAGAARVCDEIAELLGAGTESGAFFIEAAQIRSDIYSQRNDTEQYRKALVNLIELKDYAGEEYLKLYRLDENNSDYTARLKMADDMIIYSKGHSAYIKDYVPLITVMFDAAQISSYAEYEHDPSYYFSQAEEFMEQASINGCPEEDLLKFKIVMAERQGKMELAYKLLGVYLNHCPEDGFAIKEMRYLKNRVGVE